MLYGVSAANGMEYPIAGLEATLQSYTFVVGRCLLGFVFLLSGTRKLPNRQDFILVVVSYRVLPRRLAHQYARLLPWLEGSVGVMLLLGVQVRLAAALVAALLVTFIAAICLNVVRGRMDLDCGCFGKTRRQGIGVRVLLRDFALLLVAVLVFMHRGGVVSLDGPTWLLAAEPASGGVWRGAYVAGLGCIGFLLLVPLVRQGSALVGKRRSRQS